MDNAFLYLISPFLTWLIVGCTKFLLTSLKNGRVSLDNIGLGGMPSNHSAVIANASITIYLLDGLGPAFLVINALGFLFIMDALDLRIKIGLMANEINKLSHSKNKLRERIGHKLSEVIAGILFGALIGYLAFLLLVVN